MFRRKAIAQARPNIKKPASHKADFEISDRATRMEPQPPLPALTATMAARSVRLPIFQPA